MTPYRLKGASGALINQVFPLTARVLIGSIDDADIRLPAEQSGGAGRSLATLSSDASQIRLEVLVDDVEVAVNGERVSSAQLLGQGDELRVAQYRFVVQAPGLKPERILQPGSAESVRSSRWLWLLGGALAAAAGLAAAWYQGWLPPLPW